MKYLVLHCTATPEGREVTSKEIRHWHTDPVSKGGRGWKQVGYTDLVHLDGKVERLVDNNEDAEVDPWEVTNGAKGYNSVSRHIVYAGRRWPRDGKDPPKDTRDGRAAEGDRPTMCATSTSRFRQIKIGGTLPTWPGVKQSFVRSFDVAGWLKSIGIYQQ